MTAEQMSSLSEPDDRTRSRNLDPERPNPNRGLHQPRGAGRRIVQTRLNLISTLRELQALGGDKVRVRFNRTEDATATRRRLRRTDYGITSQSRRDASAAGRTSRPKTIFMGVAFTCGLEKVILPFVGRGIPVEYELVRSIVTVAKGRPRTIGIVNTDAQLYGQFDMQSMSPGRDWPIIAELEKQYNVVRVDPSQPITGKEYDVAAGGATVFAGTGTTRQPRRGDSRRNVPTADFRRSDVPDFRALRYPAPDQPRRAPGGMMGMRQPPPPKGDIAETLESFGRRLPCPNKIVWQEYNPYKTAKDVVPARSSSSPTTVPARKSRST